MSQVESALEKFLCTSFTNVRSSARTDILHAAVLTEIKNRSSEVATEYRWQREIRIEKDGFGGTFDVDLAGGPRYQRHTVVLIKAMNSNINKNIKNYANTTVGEAARIMYAAPDQTGRRFEQVVFVTLFPRVAPVFRQDGTVARLDDVLSAKSRTEIGPVLNAQYGSRVRLVEIAYDIVGIERLRKQSQFAHVDVATVSGLEGLAIL